MIASRRGEWSRGPRRAVLFALAFGLAALRGLAQSATLVPSSSSYSPSGGTATFTATINYATTPTALGFVVELPAGWSYSGGSGEPSIKPEAGTTGTLEWAYSSGFGATQSSFSFTASYPAGLTGNQTLSASAVYRSPLQNLSITPVVLSAATTANTAPAFTTPPADRSVAAGEAATFSVEVSGTPTPSVRWQVSSDGGGSWVDLVDGAGVSGATTKSLTLSATTVSLNGRRYRALASNAVQANVASSAAMLTVNAAEAAPSATLVSSVSSLQSGGGTVTLTAAITYASTPTALGFEVVLPAGWAYVGGVGEPSVKPDAGTTGTLEWAYSSGFGATSSGFSFTVSYPAGIATNQSVAATAVYRSPLTQVTVSPVVFTPGPAGTPPGFSAQPSNRSVTSGVAVSFTVAVSGTPTPTLRWQQSADGGSTWQDVPAAAPFSGVATASLTISPVTVALNGRRYRAVASNAVQADVASSAALLIVAKADQAIDFAALGPKLTTDAPFALSATASSGLPVAFAVVSGPATLSGSTLTLTGAGTVTVRATQAGNADFSAAAPVERSFAVAAPVNPNEAVVNRLYQRVLGRAPTAGEVAAELAAIAAGRTRGQMLTALLDSAAYEARQVDRVTRLYYATFNRMPDRAGLVHWARVLEVGEMTAERVAAAFASAGEFNSTYGSLTNAQFVTQMYRNTLGRDPDQGGLDYWTGQLNGGLTRGQALLAFADSAEFKERMANHVEIVRLFHGLFARLPSGAELANWLEFLRGEDQTGLFLDSSEFASRHPAGLTQAQFVQAMFSGFLLRGAEQASVDYFAGVLGAGAVSRSALVGQIVDSGEFRTVVAPVARHYLAVLQRPPDAAGGAYWAGQVRSGLTAAQLAAAFAGSAEFASAYGGLGTTAFVGAMYRNILGREADSAGLAYWSGLLAAGQSTQAGLLQAFVGSAEAEQRFAPDIRTTFHYQTFLGRTPSRGELDYWKNYLTTLRQQLRDELVGSTEFTAGG